MRRLTPDQAATLREWFLPERPGPLVGLHVLNTRMGSISVDRWPNPTVIASHTGDNWALVGQANALSTGDVREMAGSFVDADATFEQILRAASPKLIEWRRIIFRASGATPAASSMATIRPLAPSDAPAVSRLDSYLAWISNTWDGPAGLVASGMAWGAFVDRDLASVACSFFVGDRYEDIGVVTQPEHRRRGLSSACAAALCRDIRSRGHIPSWTTSTDNIASQRVAEKLGFVVDRNDRLFRV